MKIHLSVTSILLLASCTAFFLAPPGTTADAARALASVIFLVTLILTLLREPKPLFDYRQKDSESQIRHMQRVEELLERIAVAVERK